MIDSNDEAMRIAHAVLAAALGTALAGCGQKGPLYLRDNPPPNVKQARPDQYKPVPYPSRMRVDEPADAGAPADPPADSPAAAPRGSAPGK